MGSVGVVTIGQPVRTWVPSIDLVVVAASVGGLAAIEAVLGAVDATFPVPFLVVQHRRAAPNLLPQVLERRLCLPVTSCGDGTTLRGPGVYVLPPRGELHLDQERRVELRGTDRVTADQVLEVVATAYGDRCLAVILTGNRDDGARGVTAVKRAGGRVVVEDPSTAAAAGMPTAALATGNVDFALPLRYITSALIALAVAPGGADLLRVTTPVSATSA
jgi:two-component system chemotaxis response regulator CheB